jgi:hypothetical protein
VYWSAAHDGRSRSNDDLCCRLATIVSALNPVLVQLNRTCT